MNITTTSKTTTLEPSPNLPRYLRENKLQCRIKLPPRVPREAIRRHLASEAEATTEADRRVATATDETETVTEETTTTDRGAKIGTEAQDATPGGTRETRTEVVMLIEQGETRAGEVAITMEKSRIEETRIETRAEVATGPDRRRGLEVSNTRTSVETRGKTAMTIGAAARSEATETARHPRVAEIATATATAIPEPPPTRSPNPSPAARIPLSPPNDHRRRPRVRVAAVKR